MTAVINSPGDFAVALLQQLHAPVTVSNVQFLIAWANEEGGSFHNNASFNPLNTTLDAAGATSINSVGVKAYTSWDQGIGATIDTLHNGRYNDIVAALQGGNAATTAVSAAGLRTWSGGGYATIMATIPQASGPAQQAVTAAGTAATASTSTSTSFVTASDVTTSAPAATGVADPQDLIDLARILDQRADTLNTVIDGLANDVDGAAWSGPSATTFRARETQFAAAARGDADQLRAAASSLRRLADDLSVQLGQLQVIEGQVNSWFAVNGASSTVPPPWPQSDLPPTGDPRWRQVQQAFVGAGLL